MFGKKKDILSSGAQARALITRVDDTGLCTACHAGRLFSFRGAGRTGRHLALAVRLPEA